MYKLYAALIFSYKKLLSSFLFLLLPAFLGLRSIISFLGLLLAFTLGSILVIQCSFFLSSFTFGLCSWFLHISCSGRSCYCFTLICLFIRLCHYWIFNLKQWFWLHNQRFSFDHWFQLFYCRYDFWLFFTLLRLVIELNISHVILLENFLHWDLSNVCYYFYELKASILN